MSSPLARRSLSLSSGLWQSRHHLDAGPWFRTMFSCIIVSTRFCVLTSCSAWQALQGKIPSENGGSGTWICSLLSFPSKCLGCCWYVQGSSEGSWTPPLASEPLAARNWPKSSIRETRATTSRAAPPQRKGGIFAFAAFGPSLGSRFISSAFLWRGGRTGIPGIFGLPWWQHLYKNPQDPQGKQEGED